MAANRPTESLLASSAPGTIDIATSPDEQIVSLMATVLSHNVGDTVSWIRDRSGQRLDSPAHRSSLRNYPLMVQTFGERAEQAASLNLLPSCQGQPRLAGGRVASRSRPPSHSASREGSASASPP